MGKAVIVSEQGEGLYTIRKEVAGLEQALALIAEQRTKLEEELPVLRAEEEAGEIEVAYRRSVADLLVDDWVAGIDIPEQKLTFEFSYGITDEARQYVAAAVEGRVTGFEVPEAVLNALHELIEARTVLDDITRRLLDKSAQYLALLKRQAELTALEASTQTPLEVWCADYTEGLTGTVATLEVPGEVDPTLGGGLNIKPGDADDAAWDAAGYGQIQMGAVMSPAAFAWNLTMLVPWMKWMPLWRYGTVTAVDLIADTVDLDLHPILSKGRVYLRRDTTLNDPYEPLAAVPVRYMSCGAAVFEIGDEVIVEFVKETVGELTSYEPTVIGFYDNPRPCSLFIFQPLFINYKEAISLIRPPDNPGPARFGYSGYDEDGDPILNTNFDFIFDRPVKKTQVDNLGQPTNYQNGNKFYQYNNDSYSYFGSPGGDLPMEKWGLGYNIFYDKNFFGTKNYRCSVFMPILHIINSSAPFGPGCRVVQDGIINRDFIEPWQELYKVTGTWGDVPTGFVYRNGEIYRRLPTMIIGIGFVEGTVFAVGSDGKTYAFTDDPNVTIVTQTPLVRNPFVRGYFADNINISRGTVPELWDLGGYQDWSAFQAYNSSELIFNEAGDKACIVLTEYTFLGWSRTAQSVTEWQAVKLESGGVNLVKIHESLSAGTTSTTYQRTLLYGMEDDGSVSEEPSYIITNNSSSSSGVVCVGYDENDQRYVITSASSSSSESYYETDINMELSFKAGYITKTADGSSSFSITAPSWFTLTGSSSYTQNVTQSSRWNDPEVQDYKLYKEVGGYSSQSDTTTLRYVSIKNKIYLTLNTQSTGSGVCNETENQGGALSYSYSLNTNVDATIKIKNQPENRRSIHRASTADGPWPLFGSFLTWNEQQFGGDWIGVGFQRPTIDNESGPATTSRANSQYRGNLHFQNIHTSILCVDDKYVIYDAIKKTKNGYINSKIEWGWDFSFWDWESYDGESVVFLTNYEDFRSNIYPPNLVSDLIIINLGPYKK